MKTIINHYKTAICLFAAVFALNACTKNFGELNTDPKLVTTPDVKFLFTYAADRLPSSTTEWIWESLEQLMRYTQQVSASPYELSGNVNSRYRDYYADVLPNLVEIRHQIDQKTDKERYQKMRALTYIVGAYYGIRVTDLNGSIPYTEAALARYEDKFNPVFDPQQQLFTLWLSELDNAIQVLADPNIPNQESYGDADIYYQGDWIKWVKLANTLKLRIAVRLENQDGETTRRIFQEVMQDATGPIDGDDEQLQYMNPTQAFLGADVDYRSRRFANRQMVGFMKRAADPRIRIYFDQNDLVGAFRDTLAKYSVQLPDFIEPNDPLIMYQGGPADWTTDQDVAQWMGNSFQVSQYSRYFLISPVNRLFLSPKLNGATGNALHVLVSYAETCFYIAEFIQKGYGTGIDTKGSAAEWYDKGIASSIRTMNEVAQEAGSTTAFTGDGEAEILAYQQHPQVALGAANDLERIYIQQYLAFFRLPNEAYVLCRRTGYPRTASAYYPMEPFNEPIPRRFWINDPGEVNRANWEAAYQDQGFTLRAMDAQTLSQERVWYDKAAPGFGEGN
ncbi:SusD/RagB family nutrient-binding outer membrane lipoprotein [Parapedobacter koreensis]|uniref:Starch-binding associating with outer membrane n=1 Tax=Parapedobacter koreensis TaxID=332977 RepID=A0A1H7FA70_9SPHI|nr:SusD/RagB family nutrient-binding outer membrane lipoprotein [Parapedobacter koreensis]SEK20920.1 Starch-binding associating with outer membrane [Parapedobacter koreensis]